MSAEQTSLPVPETFDYKHVGTRWVGLCLTALAALLVSFLLGAADPKQFAFSWLFAGSFFFTILVGCLFWVVVHHATDAAWSVGIRRQWENLSCLLPLLFLLLVPLCFVAPLVWTWMGLDPRQNHELAEKSAYLNVNFFWIRAAFYVAFFSLIAWILRRNSLAQDTDGSLLHSASSRRIAFLTIPVGAVALSFWAIDWLMGLQWKWNSTIWGLYIFAGCALSALCVIILVANALRGAGYLAQVLTPEHNYALGKLLLAFTLFWSWIAYVQYMLIWYADIPEEAAYYVIRSSGSWKVLGILLVAGHFIVPFALLLLRAPKASAGFLGLVAGWILAMHLLDIYTIVLPVLHPEGFRPALLDVTAILALGCTLGAVYLKQLGDSPLWPTRDPRLAEASTHTD